MSCLGLRELETLDRDSRPGKKRSELWILTLAADPPHVVDFRKEVAAWMAEEFKGHEHLRWSASWSTREDEDEYKFRRGLAEKLGKKGWLFPLVS